MRCRTLLPHFGKHDAFLAPRGRRPSRKLILFGQKDRHDPSCHSRICWIEGMESEVVVVIVDFEEDLLPRDLDKPEIVLAERVIVLIKIVVSRDRDQNGLIKVDT